MPEVIVKQLKITARQLKDGLRIKHGHMDLLIIADQFSGGVLVALKPRPTGREQRDIQLKVRPVSSATIVLEGSP